MHPKRSLLAVPAVSAISIMALAFVLELGSVAGLGAEEVRSSRALEIPAAGWVRVPLEPEVLRRSASAGGHLRVLDPQGLEVAYRRTAATAGERRPVTVVGVEEIPTGWWLSLDLGEGPPRHDGLAVELTQRTLARGCRLESSADGVTYNPLAVGDLFRLGDDSTLAVREIRYPATADRWLRLFWPAGAGYPEVEKVEAQAVSGRAFQLESGRPECRPRAETRETRCRLTLAAASAGLRRLDLVVEPQGAVGFRLSRPEAGRWRLVAEGLWTETGRERSLPVEGVPADAETLLLELHGEAKAPEVTRYRAEFDGEELLFEARRAGRYELIYGAGVPEPLPARSGGPPAQATILEIQPGPETSAPVHGLAADGALGAVAPDVLFAKRWRVAAPDAVPGLLFRLVGPPDLYEIARADLGDLRFLAEGRQVPHVRWQPPEPALVTEWPSLTPTEAGKSGRSVFELPARKPRAAAVRPHPLGAAGGALRPPGQRALGSEGRPGVPRQTVAAAATVRWACQSVPPLPCRLELALEGAPAGARRLLLDVDDGDDAPLPGLGARLWRRLDVFLFRWPEGVEQVTLEAGAGGLAAPRYELENRRGELLSQSWRGASVIEESASPEAGRRGRWVLLGSLGIAALFLVGLLHRILKDREGPH